MTLNQETLEAIRQDAQAIRDLLDEATRAPAHNPGPAMTVTASPSELVITPESLAHVAHDVGAMTMPQPTPTPPPVQPPAPAPVAPATTVNVNVPADKG